LKSFSAGTERSIPGTVSRSIDRDDAIAMSINNFRSSGQKPSHPFFDGNGPVDVAGFYVEEKQARVLVHNRDAFSRACMIDG
jgi:hypothetical protein